MQVEELFVEVPGFPNYAVSNYGRVVNIKRDRDLTPWSHSKSGNKYIVKLWNDGFSQNFFVHRLVAQAFFVDFDDVVDVYHISENKQDNCVTNLHLALRYK